MTRTARLAGVGALAVILAVAVAVAVAGEAGEAGAGERPRSSALDPRPTGIPRLVDLGAGTCVPCKAMAPILDRLRTDYAGKLEVEFVDVWKDRRAAEPYRIQMIPTQIFYGADGRELSRHEGFMSREEILGRWRSLGVALD